MPLSSEQIVFFVLIFARIAGLFSQSAFFSFRVIPAFVRTAIVFFTSFVIVTNLPMPAVLPNTTFLFIVAIMQEVFIGRIIGFVSFIIMQSIVAAGSMMGMQMGLSSAMQFDPMHGMQVNVIGSLFDYAALIFFLVIDGHIMILVAIQKSFLAIPVFSSVDFSAPIEQFLFLGSLLWELAIRFASPVILAIFLLDFAFGTISRVAPQVNVFMLGFQIKPVLGLFTIYLMIPILIWRIVDLIGTILEKTITIMTYLKATNFF